MAGKKYHVRNLTLAPQGRKRILWADQDMPVLRRARERFRKEKPLRGLPVSACVQVTRETANWMQTLEAGGPELVPRACNPLPTPDDGRPRPAENRRIPSCSPHVG